MWKLLATAEKMVVLNNAPVLLLHTIFLFISLSKSTANIWFPKSLPCDVMKDGPAVVVDCSERELRYVPTGFPSNATNISLTINHILEVHSTSFSGLSDLTEIDLRCNCVPVRMGPKDKECTNALRIHKGAFSSLPALRSLYLDGNQLNGLPQGLPHTLTMLSLEANSIFVLTKANLSVMSNLEAIYLGQNCYYRNPCNTSYQIERDAFYGLSNLTILSLKDNNLTHVPGKLPRSLKQLLLYNNMIKEINDKDFAELPELETLDLSGNCPRCYNAPFPCQPCQSPSYIQIHANAFQTLNKLKTLRLQSNSLSTVPSSWFKNTSNLRLLDLSENFLLKEIANAAFLKYLTKLEAIDLSFNYELKLYAKYLNLSENFSNLQSLQSLRIRGYVFKNLKEEHLKPLWDLRNLKFLDLGTNFIKVANLQIFKKFHGLKVLDLSENKISPSSGDSAGAQCSSNKPSQAPNAFYGWSDQMHYFRYDGYGRSCKSKAEKEASYPFVPSCPTECGRLGSFLDLSRNNIFFVGPTLFEGLSSLRCLNLSGNALSQTPNGSEFQHLPDLRYLDLSNNRIDLLYETAFQELRKLRVLDLSHNSHYFEMEGLTHRLGFIQNLTALSKLFLNGNAIHSSADTVLKSRSLRVLEFRGNRLDYMWRDGTTHYLQLFRGLVNLTRLDLSSNLLTFIPQSVFETLPPRLEELVLASNQLRSFKWLSLRHLDSLRLLDLGGNQLTSVPRSLADCAAGLRRLVLAGNRITRLGRYFLRGAVSLRELDLSKNRLRMIEASSLPPPRMPRRLLEEVGSGSWAGLRVLRLDGNPFACSCDATSWLAWWLNRTEVHVPRLVTGVTCASPRVRRGLSVLSLDRHACELDSLGAGLHATTAGLTLSLLLVSLAARHLSWDVRYAYHVCAAKLRGYRRLPSSPASSAAYSAFVAYDTHDLLVTDWVLKELIIHLEETGDRRLCLCLEDRDWVPGRLVLENLSHSVHRSRKTIFVLTRPYIATGQFRTAFHMAHQRLLDEKLDVIVLVLLDKVWQRSRYLRLKKRLSRHSVLEWPRNPRAQPLFWQRLRSTLTTDSHVQHGKLFNEIV
ncbi:toll-like receptor 7 [Chiloscyllium plagiosum]|uniref:toll-like receptor 7 n=1 Tax=Chiloscyllium plagiosum TaxID=36176 RepID=UPI001CB85A35|nr:toll-like receptor 7 [Chiloscyllium plagiosum]